jgi:hypothetical protein
MENKTCVRSSHIGSYADCELTYVKAAARCHDEGRDVCTAPDERPLPPLRRRGGVDEES